MKTIIECVQRFYPTPTFCTVPPNKVDWTVPHCFDLVPLSFPSLSLAKMACRAAFYSGAYTHFI